MTQSIKAFSVMPNDPSLNSGVHMIGRENLLSKLYLVFSTFICVPLRVQTYAKGKNE